MTGFAASKGVIRDRLRGSSGWSKGVTGDRQCGEVDGRRPVPAVLLPDQPATLYGGLPVPRESPPVDLRGFGQEPFGTRELPVAGHVARAGQEREPLVAGQSLARAHEGLLPGITVHGRGHGVASRMNRSHMATDAGARPLRTSETCF